MGKRWSREKQANRDRKREKENSGNKSEERKCVACCSVTV
jgi:hypothetical protein